MNKKLWIFRYVWIKATAASSAFLHVLNAAIHLKEDTFQRKIHLEGTLADNYFLMSLMFTLPQTNVSILENPILLVFLFFDGLCLFFSLLCASLCLCNSDAWESKSLKKCLNILHINKINKKHHHHHDHKKKPIAAFSQQLQAAEPLFV